MQTPNQAPKDLFSRIRHHRLTATFALLATLSLGILAGSVLTRTVSGKEQAVDSSDARPLSVPSPIFQSNEFAKIAKAVGPAVVNINTITLPKQSINKRSGRGGNAQRGPSIQPDPDGGDSQGDMQDFFNRFFGGQGGGGGTMAPTPAVASARRSAPASSSTRAATSSPTTMWSTRPTRFM